MTHKFKTGDRVVVLSGPYSGEILEVKGRYPAFSGTVHCCERSNGRVYGFMENELGFLNKEENMNEFKAGDKVVRVGDNYMDVKKGEVYEVLRIDRGGLILKGVPYFGYSLNQFDKAVSPKFLLKNGDEIHYRDGDVRYLLNGKLYAESSGELVLMTSLDSFNDDLTYNYTIKNTGQLDVMLVLRDGNGVVFERKEEPEIKELTLKEIADKFGMSVEQLRIKEK